MRRLPTVTTRSRDEIWAVVVSHMGLCGRLAARYTGRGLDRDDLVQEGCFGLYRAVELYDPATIGGNGKPVKFSVYAADWIRQAMLEAISYTGRSIHIPRDTLRIACREPAPVPSQRSLLTPEKAECVTAALAARRVGSIPASDEDWSFRAPAQRESESESDPGATEPEPGPLDDMHYALDQLDARERAVLEAHHLRGLTYQQVAGELGLTRQRAHQISVNALAKLRRIVA